MKAKTAPHEHFFPTSSGEPLTTLARAKVPEDELLVLLQRGDKYVFLRVPREHEARVLALTEGEFADKSIQLGGPRLPAEE